MDKKYRIPDQIEYPPLNGVSVKLLIKFSFHSLRQGEEKK